MKKYLSLFLSIIFVCMSFVGCSKSSFDIIDNALKNTKDLDSISAEMNMTFDMSMGEMEFSVPFTATVKAKDLHTDKPISSTKISMTMMENEVEMEVYQEGDKGYVVMDDMRYKTDITKNNSQYDYKDDIDNIVKELPKEFFNGVKVVKEKKGKTSVEVAIDNDEFNEIYKDYIDFITENSDFSGSEIETSDAKVKITVADGHVSVYDLQFTMDVKAQGVSTKLKVKANVSYDNPDNKVKITPPKGYKYFEELSYFS